MPKNKQGHGIVLDDKGQEQPMDKDRAQTVNKTKSGHMPQQPDEKKRETADSKLKEN